MMSRVRVSMLVLLAVLLAGGVMSATAYAG